MKVVFQVQSRKGDGSIIMKGVLAQDSGTPTVPAIIRAANAALADAGEGAEVIQVLRASQIDIDATI
jgi:hypothetical protein